MDSVTIQNYFLYGIYSLEKIVFDGGIEFDTKAIQDMFNKSTTINSYQLGIEKSIETIVGTSSSGLANINTLTSPTNSNTNDYLANLSSN